MTKTKTSFAQGQLRSLIERIERLEEEKASIAGDIKEVYAEAKANGFDTKIMRMVVSLRKKDVNERQEQEALLDVYLAALGMQMHLGEIEETEPLPDGASRPVESSGGWTVSADAPAAPIQTLPKVPPALPASVSEAAGDPQTPPAADYSMPELPAFLDRRKHTVAA